MVTIIFAIIIIIINFNINIYYVVVTKQVFLALHDGP